MNYKPGDLPDLKYASESLIPRVIGCTSICQTVSVTWLDGLILCAKSYSYEWLFFSRVTRKIECWQEDLTSTAKVRETWFSYQRITRVLGGNNEKFIPLF